MPFFFFFFFFFFENFGKMEFWKRKRFFLTVSEGESFRGGNLSDTEEIRNERRLKRSPF